MRATLIEPTQRRTTATGGGIMETMASPTVGSSHSLCLWKVTMDAGQSGPEHSISSDQVWTLLGGEATIVIEGEALHMGTGDTATIAGGACRQVTAVVAAEFLVAGLTGAAASVAGGSVAVTPPWIT